MFKSIAIIYKLFKNSFFVTAILYLVAIVIFISVIALKDAYKFSLQNEFATKQPHIKIKFIDDNVEKTPQKIEKDIKFIKIQSNLIDKITPFVSGNRFYSVDGSKEGGNTHYNGNIKIIGIGSDEMVYNFFDSSFVFRKPFEILYTPLEFMYAFKTEKNIMIFNNALFNSFFPVIESVEDLKFKNKNEIYKGKLASVFNDYDTQPIIYTTIPFANKLLNNNQNRISGYYINSKDINKIDELTTILKNSLSKKEFIVTSWLQDRKKQFTMFNIFNSIALIIVFTVLLLSILFILLILYNSIVKKSYHLSVFYTLGFILKKEIFIFMLFIISIITILAFIIVSIFIPKLILFLNLPYNSSMIFYYFIYIMIINLFFSIISFILIDNSYKLKTKSLF